MADDRSYSDGSDAKVTLSGETSLDLDMPLDAEKVTAIKACLERGRLQISLSQLDLAAGRLGDGYKYD